ncbi:MAG: ribokinase [Opitutales bacterium]
MKPQVIVVGSFVQDLTFFCEHFPSPGQTTVGTFATGPGGKGSNQAVAAGRTGVPTLFIGAVGRDAFAAEAKKFYAAEGIGARFVVKPRHATATAGIIVNQSGQNEIVVALGASAQIQPRDVNARLIREARVVVCQHEATLPINAHVFRLARRAGVTTVLNPAPMRPDFDAAILPLTDILVPNETEFVALVRRLPGPAALVRQAPFTHAGPFGEASLPGLAPADLHRLCRAFGLPTVIVTLGSRGCFVSQAGAFAALPACRGVKAVDTTGAGDAFCGGLAAGLCKFDGDLVVAARFANTVAALSVTRRGTAPAMPTAGEIARFLRR